MSERYNIEIIFRDLYSIIKLRKLTTTLIILTIIGKPVLGGVKGIGGVYGSGAGLEGDARGGASGSGHYALGIKVD